MNLPNLFSRFAAVLTTLLVLAGCAMTNEPADVPIPLPASFSQTGTDPLAKKWWTSFHDPTLDALIEEALGNNFSLLAAWDRLHQAKALYRVNRASLFPSLEGGADGSHKIERTDGSTSKTDALTIGLSAEYELDLWGRINSTVDAIRLDMEASRADLDTAAMTLSAEVANAWYTLIMEQSQLALLEEQIQVNKKGLEIIMAQFRTGQVPMADVLQQRQLLESNAGERTQLIAEHLQTQHLLTILLGLPPGSRSFDIPEHLIELPHLPSTGVPAELLLNRPDIRSAFYGVQAADSRVAAAIADRFPALRFTFSLDTSGTSSATLFHDYLASLAASLTAPLFDAGSRKAEVDRTKAVAEEQLHLYAQAILEAAAEVEDALIIEKQQLLYIESLAIQIDLANGTISQVKDQYLNGVEDYERVLSAVISLQGLQQTMLSAQKTLLTNRIELCRALGSGWNLDDGTPPSNHEKQAL